MSTLVYVVYLLVMIYFWLIVVRAMLSWFPVRPGSPVFTIKRAPDVVTAPYLRLLRRMLPMVRIGSVGLDLSSLVGLIVLVVLVQVLSRL
jgi:YggT family protein